MVQIQARHYQRRSRKCGLIFMVVQLNKKLKIIKIAPAMSGISLPRQKQAGNYLITKIMSTCSATFWAFFLSNESTWLVGYCGFFAFGQSIFSVRKILMFTTAVSPLSKPTKNIPPKALHSSKGVFLEILWKSKKPSTSWRKASCSVGKILGNK